MDNSPRIPERTDSKVCALRRATQRKIRTVASEEEEQITFVQWLKLNHIIHYHIPNGGYRYLSQAARFKLMGVSPGVPDICIPIPTEQYHGLYIEIKSMKGVVSSHQKQWMEDLSLNGYFVSVARGCAEAMNITKNYFKKM